MEIIVIITNLSETFSTYFLSLPEKTSQNITNDNIINCSKERTPLHYSSQSTLSLSLSKYDIQS